MLKAIDDYLEETILLILLVLMTCIMGIQIVSRYVFQNSLTWSEELVRYMFVWSAFLGVPFCIKHGLSIKVDQFRNLFPIPLQKVLMYIDKIIIFLLFLVLFIYSFTVVKATYLSGQTSPAMQLPMWTVQISVTVSSLLSMIRSIQNLSHLVRGKIKLEQKDGVLYQK
ncbi:TRAP transporter small permease [Fusobacterium animalis]|jgi:TRAP tripartite ATP-independent transporter, periplasmic protein|uniref:TRAP-T family tripartite ATP-independent periplasmic transporter, membrane protein n=2 Tax=Fusobacterium animalis TaxID=76859 RepID=F9EN36_9FUSO|nr:MULTISPECIES: TRAP transporter small permease [Fusobacterium]EGQ79639.1 TRAP-T family tripartite ATP-independent periplasmic transporter, membrane protein [Fusobacterium animalis ATCC 51191]PIM89951.1 TRAP transporter small permease [Fusobacterium animalis]PIM93841.1 TRAP transporter small permease [Fusobacterium animalis]